MNPLKALSEHGQSIWLDFLARGFIASGGLKRLVEEDGLAGVTSNPAIFEKAIGEGSDYDAAVSAAQAKGDRAVGELYEGLAVEDIRAAADVLKPVFDATRGGDGFVSLEVSPYLAMDADGTAVEARRLWRAVERKNLDGQGAGHQAGGRRHPHAGRRRPQHQRHAVVRPRHV